MDICLMGLELEKEYNVACRRSTGKKSYLITRVVKRPDGVLWLTMTLIGFWCTDNKRALSLISTRQRLCLLHPTVFRRAANSFKGIPFVNIFISIHSH